MDAAALRVSLATLVRVTVGWTLRLRLRLFKFWYISILARWVTVTVTNLSVCKVCLLELHGGKYMDSDLSQPECGTRLPLVLISEVLDFKLPVYYFAVPVIQVAPKKFSSCVSILHR